jgi:transposase-like protein
LKGLAERRIQTRQLAVKIDGVRLGDCIGIAAVGIYEAGQKRVLGLAEGATESAASVGSLLDSPIEKGLDPCLPTLFVIDGAKALRKAVRDRFSGAAVQRCRIHKVRNVIEHLPLAKRRALQAKLNLAYRLPCEEALEKLEEIARERSALHPGAAGSLLEGLGETLTVSRLRLSPLLVTSLSSTNLIESSFSRARSRLREFTNYQGGAMAMRWCASALLMAEQGFRTVRGVKDLWVLKAALDGPPKEKVEYDDEQRLLRSFN